jgi:hypothetical protein
MHRSRSMHARMQQRRESREGVGGWERLCANDLRTGDGRVCTTADGSRRCAKSDAAQL